MSEGTSQIVDQGDYEEEDTVSSSSSSLLLPPGSNLACNENKHEHENELGQQQKVNVRVRQEWNELSNYDRELYLDAIETAVERGYHKRFAKFHYDKLSEIQAHDTCGFFIWHRIFVLAYEDMLRSLGTRYSCITIPYWDIYRDYKKQQQQSEGSVCRSYATCSKIMNDLGGIVQNDDFHELTYFGEKVDGLWHFKSPIQNLRDDNNQVGLIRYDMWFDPIPDEANLLNPINLATTLFRTDDTDTDTDSTNRNNRIKFWEQLHHGIHDAIHDTIGGFMRTNASPLDPIFMPLHSTMDLFDYIWEVCHHNHNHSTITATTNTNSMIGIDNDVDDNVNNDGNDKYDNQNIDINNRCTYTKEARKYFPNISIDEYGNENENDNNNNEVYMKLNNETDIRDDPLIGTFFSSSLTYFANYSNILQLNQHQRFRYSSNNIPESLIEALSNNTQLCPNGLSSIIITQIESAPTPTQDDDDDVDNNNDDNEKNQSLTTMTLRESPTFTTSQIETFKSDWIEQAIIYSSIATTTSNSTHQLQQQQELSYNNNSIEFIRCLLNEMDRDTLERWAIDDGTFMTQVIKNKRYNNHPSCRNFLSLSTASASAAGTTTVLNSSNSNNNSTTVKNSSTSSSNSMIHYYGLQQQRYYSWSWLVFILLLQIVLFKLM